MSAAMKRKLTTEPMPMPRVKTLVYGLGETGLSVARYLSRLGVDGAYVDSRQNPPGIDELRRIDPGARIVNGALPKSLLDGMSQVIVSPGIKDDDRFLEAAREAGVGIYSDIEVFMRAASADVVGITGSNGKSTVTTLLGLMCKAAGLVAPTGGNLGRPALDLLLEDSPDVFVVELSSFQLHRTQTLPLKVAVLLNITPDHLDWHKDEAEYRRAKFRIFKQAESIVVNRDDPTLLRDLPPGLRACSFGLGAPERGHYGVIREQGIDYLARGNKALLACDDVALMGLHNRANVLAAMAAGELLGLDLTAMLQVVTEFPGLPHRMQFVRCIDGVDYVNDSKATNVAAAIASVRSIEGPVVLLLGGQGKGGDFDQLAEQVAEKCRAVLLFGEDAPLLKSAFGDLAELHVVADLSAAVERAQSVAVADDTVLLAPACASFDQFDNYMQRGDVFRTAVEALEL